MKFQLGLPCLLILGLSACGDLNNTVGGMTPLDPTQTGSIAKVPNASFSSLSTQTRVTASNYSARGTLGDSLSANKKTTTSGQYFVTFTVQGLQDSTLDR